MTEPRCELCERPLRGGAAAYLCAACTMATLDRLGDLPGAYRQLEDFLQPVQRPGARRAAAIHSPALTNFAVVDVRSEMARTLGSWHRALYAALEWDAPDLIEDQERRLAAAVKTLLDNVRWIASSWPAAGDFAREIRDLRQAALSVMTRQARPRIGLCPAEHDNGGQCGAVLRAPTRGTVITCHWCGTEYPPETWAALRRSAPANQTGDAA